MLLYVLLFILGTAQGTDWKKFSVRANNETIAEQPTDRCYCFTWLSAFDATQANFWLDKKCFDKYGTYNPMPLCQDPMVFTNNSLQPNFNYLLEHHYDAVTCSRLTGYTCVKYTYRFNGEVQNITRYATKVTVGSHSMESGCLTDTDGPYETEICACNDMLGKNPCNGSSNLFVNMLPFLTSLITFHFVINR